MPIADYRSPDNSNSSWKLNKINFLMNNDELMEHSRQCDNATLSWFFEGNLFAKILIICSLIFICWRSWFIYQEGQIIYLKVKLIGSSSNSLQLYYDQGHGFNELDSVVINNSENVSNKFVWLKLSKNSVYQNAKFELPRNDIYRFKITSLSKNLLNLKEIKIVDGLGATLKNINFKNLYKIKGSSAVELKIYLPLKSENIEFSISRFVTRVILEGFLFVLLGVLLTKIQKVLVARNTVIRRMLAYYFDSNFGHIVLLFFLTAIFLWVYRPLGSKWFPVLFEKTLFIVFIILALKFLLSTKIKNNKIYLIIYGSVFYFMIIGISAIMNYLSLDYLGQVNYISIYSQQFSGVLFDKYEWSKKIIDQGSAYLYFFPFMLLVAIKIFNSVSDRWKLLLHNFYIFIPCILVAMYQIYFDRNFLNNRSIHDSFGGLASSFISFRILLFLFFPLAVLGMILSKSWFKKTIYFVSAGAILWLTYLSAGRAAIIGILIFLFTVPLIRLLVNDFIINKRKKLLYVSSFGIVILILVVGFVHPDYQNYSAKVFTKRTTLTINAILTGNFSFPQVANRTEMARQAFRIIGIAPVSGFGPAAFMKNVERIRYANGDIDGNEYQPMTNLYLEMWCNYGLIGTLAILFLLLMPLAIIALVRKNIFDKSDKWAAGIISSTAIIMLLLFFTNPNIDYQEINWIYSLYLGFLVSMGLKYGYEPPQINKKNLIVGCILMLACFIAGTYKTTFGSQGYKNVQKELISYITDGFIPNDKTILWDSNNLQERKELSSKIIRTSGNPFRMRYTTNVIRFHCVSKGYNIPEKTKLLCIKSTILNDGFEGDYILGFKFFLNNIEIDKHLFYSNGEKCLYFIIPESKSNSVIFVDVDLQKSVPYHYDDRNNVAIEYMPSHKDFSDLKIKIEVVSFDLLNNRNWSQRKNDVL